MKKRLLEWDFWFQGALTFPVWILLFLVYRTGWADSPRLAAHLGELPAFFGVLTILVNTPHFFWSYKLAYQRGVRFSWKYWLQLIFVPSLLVILFALAWHFWDTPVQKIGFPVNAAAFLSKRGLGLEMAQYAGVGSMLMGNLLVIQYTLSAWHYSRQAFGVTMINLRGAGMAIARWQRHWLHWSLLSICLVYIAEVNSGVPFWTTFGIKNFTLGWPLWSLRLSYALWGVSIAGAAFIFAGLFMKYRGSFDPSVFFPFAAMHFWFVPVIYKQIPAVYFPFFVPCAHGLQYLVFVHRVESGRGRDAGTSPFAVFWTILSVILIGFMFSEFLPSWLDQKIVQPVRPGLAFFAAASFIMINIHHYFIDNVIWRAENVNPKYIFGQLPVSP